MIQPDLVSNWPAVIGAVIAAFALGFVWYGPLFGRKWATLIGMDLTRKPEKFVMMRAFALQLLGTFFTAYVLMHQVQVWRPSVWGLGQDAPSFVFGLYCAVFTWIGFYVPSQLGKIAWENQPWSLFLINTGYDFVMLQMVCQILAHWR